MNIVPNSFEIFSGQVRYEYALNRGLLYPCLTLWLPLPYPCFTPGVWQPYRKGKARVKQPGTHAVFIP
jgi:hypothetical protein